jgi:prepilin-type N-terminal cleavage/methylation domain-containing protein
MKKAFTLAETLITLGIIGIVAAITIPALVNSYKSKQLRSQFLEAYSIINQATRRMVADDISIDCSMSNSDSTKLVKTYAKYLQGATFCSSIRYNTKCQTLLQASKYYKTLDGNNYVGDSLLDDGTLILQNGMIINFENLSSAASPCYLFVDINGTSKPNRLGYDLFTFQLLNDTEKLVPMGDPSSKYPDTDKKCNINIKYDSTNGISCTEKAKNDPDYFKYIVKALK